MNLKNGKVFRSKFVGTGPSSFEKRIYRTAVSQRLRNTGLHKAEFLTEWVAASETISLTLLLLTYSALVCGLKTVKQSHYRFGQTLKLPGD